MCVSRESNPDLLLGRQQCWPLHHSRTSWLDPAWLQYLWLPHYGDFPFELPAGSIPWILLFLNFIIRVMLPSKSNSINIENAMLYGYENHTHTHTHTASEMFITCMFLRNLEITQYIYKCYLMIVQQKWWLCVFIALKIAKFRQG